MGPYELFKLILALNESQDWHEAKWECKMEAYQKLEKEWSNCICGHRIKEICIIRNQLNGNEAQVGNCCLTKFPYQESRLYAFRALVKCKINKYVIDFAHKLDVINDWEHEFMMDNFRRWKLSDKQKYYLRKIRRKILNALNPNCK